MTTTLHQTEAQLQDAVIELATILQWTVAHFRPARTEKGWRTPVAAHGKGFPDLLLARERVVAIELKSERGRLTPEQAEWLDVLAIAGVECHVFRPSDWRAIERTLRRVEGVGS